MHRARLGIFFCLRQLLGIGTDAIDLVPSVGGRICQETPILRVFEKTTRAGVKVWDKAIFVSVLGMEKVMFCDGSSIISMKNLLDFMGSKGI